MLVVGLQRMQGPILQVSTYSGKGSQLIFTLPAFLHSPDIDEGKGLLIPNGMMTKGI